MEQLRQVGGRVVIGGQFATGHPVQAFMRGAGGLLHHRVRAVARIYETDVVILAIEAAKRRPDPEQMQFQRLSDLNPRPLFVQKANDPVTLEALPMQAG